MKSPKPLKSAALQNAFEQYRPELRRFLRGRTHQAQTANDLAQEVYLRILRFPPSEVVLQPQAYLYRVASNVVHDFNLRAQAERVTYDSEIVESLAERPTELAADHLEERIATQQELARALAPLPPAWQAALILRKRDGLSYVEIAKELGVSVHAIKKYIARAVAELRNRKRER
jgi:RNA polymerase sigma-70 factor (ECF subfamily)